MTPEDKEEKIQRKIEDNYDRGFEDEDLAEEDL